jgi:hypothetical protein
MFGRDKKVVKQQQSVVERWTQERDAYTTLLQTAMTFQGNTANELMLAAGEAVFYKVTGCSLIEDRKTAGHWEGRSAGVSIPVGSIGGHSVRYRVGTSKGHYVQGTPRPTAIDTGTVYITNKRVVFQGSRQTRECQFAKLIGFHHDDRAGSTTFSVSNRKTPTTVHYGPGLSDAFDFRLDLALAHYKGTLDSLIRQLQDDLAKIDAARPTGAVGVAPMAAAVQAGAPPAQSLAAWLKGPGGQADAAMRAAVGQLTLANQNLKANGSTPDARQRVMSAYQNIDAAASAALIAPPVPDTAAQSLRTQMLLCWKKAAVSIQAGMKTQDANLLSQGTDALNEANRYALELAQRFRQPS